VSIRKAAALVRRGSVWAAKRNPLTFDPPAELIEGALFRDGSPWRPKVAQASSLSPGGNSPIKSSPATSTALGRQDARPTPGPGTATISGRDPGEQAEKDWIDNRWSRTDVGQFLASSLRVPNGTVNKALTIRVGPRDEASVCFDTANLNLRVGWTGGFLKLD